MPSPKCALDCDGSCGRKHRKRCPDGCTCKRHEDRSCRTGCTCPRHISRPRYTEEQREHARSLRLAKQREYARQRYATDTRHVESVRVRNFTRGRAYWLKSKFGMTPEQWSGMFDRQGGACYLCGDQVQEPDVHIDHDHLCCSGVKSCGRCIRGLACRWCNQGLGQFRDDPDRMIRVAENLKKARHRIQLAARP